jgi:hypothetical protein
LSEAISLSASDFINESTAANPANDGTSLILSAVLHELKLLTVRNNTRTRTTQCNQRDSVGIHSLGPPCELLAGADFLVTTAPFCVACCECATAVLLHLTSYFYNWPVRIWPICRPEGAVGTHSPWCRSQWPYNIPWPLCSLWWGGGNWPHGAPGTDPPKIGVLECASGSFSIRLLLYT